MTKVKGSNGRLPHCEPKRAILCFDRQYRHLGRRKPAEPAAVLQSEVDSAMQLNEVFILTRHLALVAASVFTRAAFYINPHNTGAVAAHKYPVPHGVVESAAKPPPEYR